MVKVILKLMKKIIWIIVIAGMCTAMYFGFRYADRVCREYFKAFGRWMAILAVHRPGAGTGGREC